MPPLPRRTLYRVLSVLLLAGLGVTTAAVPASAAPSNTWTTGPNNVQTSAGYQNSRELHQTGENPQVAWSQRWRSQFRGLGVLAA
jgi:hypothetical protein